MKTILKPHVIHYAVYNDFSNEVQFYERVDEAQAELAFGTTIYPCFKHSSEGGVTVMTCPPKDSIVHEVRLEFSDGTTPTQAVILFAAMLGLKAAAAEDEAEVAAAHEQFVG